uniref:Uncharacterized protein n=1 Tax=Parascaris equorum TaxID=6256 RepID=A0A914RH20_PAREQ
MKWQNGLRRLLALKIVEVHSEIRTSTASRCCCWPRIRTTTWALYWDSSWDR